LEDIGVKIFCTFVKKLNHVDQHASGYANFAAERLNLVVAGDIVQKDGYEALEVIRNHLLIDNQFSD